MTLEDLQELAEVSKKMGTLNKTIQNFWTFFERCGGII